MKRRVIFYSLGKYHTFSLAEQLDKKEFLFKLITGHYSKRKSVFNMFIQRIDVEDISISRVKCLPILFGLSKKLKNLSNLWMSIFDLYCFCNLLLNRKEIDIIIVLSGYNTMTLKLAKKLGKKTIVDRGAAHIVEQQRLLNSEYSKFNKQIRWNKFIKKRELSDYHNADFLAIPSEFVKSTFIKHHINENKLFLNPYGTTNLFKDMYVPRKYKFEITFVGNISIQKGIHIIIDTAKKLYSINPEIHFTVIGSGDKDFIRIINNQKNMTYEGYKKHTELPLFMNRADFALVPSIQDGYSLVVVQFLRCKTPVILSKFVGSKDLIMNKKNSYILKNNDSNDITNIILEAFEKPQILKSLKRGIEGIPCNKLSFDGYGDRWIDFLEGL